MKMICVNHRDCIRHLKHAHMESIVLSLPLFGRVSSEDDKRVCSCEARLQHEHMQEFT